MEALFLGDANARLETPKVAMMEERQIQPLDRSTKNIYLVAVWSKKGAEFVKPCLMLLFILNVVVAMPTWLQYVFLIAGTVGGYFLGEYWWRVVYLQRRYWYFRMKERSENKGAL